MSRILIRLLYILGLTLPPKFPKDGTPKIDLIAYAIDTELSRLWHSGMGTEAKLEASLPLHFLASLFLPSSHPHWCIVN
jgi:hypothetical protein